MVFPTSRKVSYSIHGRLKKTKSVRPEIREQVCDAQDLVLGKSFCSHELKNISRNFIYEFSEYQRSWMPYRETLRIFHILWPSISHRVRKDLFVNSYTQHWYRAMKKHNL